MLRQGARRRERESAASIESERVGQGGQRDGDSDGDQQIVPLIREGISTLPRKQAQAVLLRLLEDQQFDVIGRVLGCSEVTARSHVSKGLAKLREYLAELGLNLAEG